MGAEADEYYAEKRNNLRRLSRSVADREGAKVGRYIGQDAIHPALYGLEDVSKVGAHPC